MSLDPVTVPNFVGMNSLQIEAICNAEGLTMANSCYDIDNLSGSSYIVVAQNPPADSLVNRGSTILLDFGRGVYYA